MAVDVDRLPPTQYLILDVLAARWRLGERCWTFPAKLTKQADKLDQLGLVWWKWGIVEHTILIGLTDAGEKTVLSSTYIPGRQYPRHKIEEMP